MFHNCFTVFPCKKNENINTQLLFSTVNIKKVIEPWTF